MSEKPSGERPDVVIDLPSRLRIRQLMGMISHNRIFEKQVAPRFKNMGGRSMPVDSFLTEADAKLHGSDETPGLYEIGRERMPRIISLLVRDSSQQTATLERWSEIVAEQQSHEITGSD
jgi:hypothetical protein